MMLHDTHDLIHVQLNEEIKLTAFNLQHFNISFFDCHSISIEANIQ